MNERVKQLLGQAYDEAVPETWTELSSIQLKRIYDKFAQLIVLECCRILEHNHHDTISRPIASDFIKKHFGVE